MDVLHTKVAEPLVAVNAVQEIAVYQVTPYRVSFGRATTAEIAADASAAQVQTALRALSTINGGNVNVTGSAGGPYSVTFVSALAGSPQPLLTTGFKNVRIRELVAGRRPTGYGLETGAVLATEEPAIYQQTGTPTSPVLTPVGGVTDHGELDGLADNDHPQYLLAADYDAPVTDHGALTGLADNDHPQYVRGLANGVRVAAGVQDISAATHTVVTGLATVLAVVASYQSNPSRDQLWVSASPGDQAGTPDAGSFILKTWQSDESGSVAWEAIPIPTNNFAGSPKVAWIAVGS